MHKPLTARSMILGLDFGMKKMGVAIGQQMTGTANPLGIVSAKEGEPDWAALDRLMKQWEPAALVVGIPLNMDGTRQPITTKAENFTQKLEKRYELPVYKTDERLSTREARDQLFSEGGYRALQDPVDSMAAKIILEGWLSAHQASKE